MTGEKWTIFWNEHASDTYLYGAKLQFHKKDDVEYENLLMPPGTIIKKWYSKTNYQAQRIEPSVPMIDGESEYRITVNIDTEENQQCLVKLLFFDRYENEAGSIIVKGDSMRFRCPLKTYSYEMQLINGGTTHFHFHSIVIQEVVNETEK